MVRAGGGRAQQRQLECPPPNPYHQMLECIGLNAAAITALELLGLDHVGAFHDLTQNDIPSIVKEL
jgi:hypothetical protein